MWLDHFSVVGILLIKCKIQHFTNHWPTVKPAWRRQYWSIVISKRRTDIRLLGNRFRLNIRPMFLCYLSLNWYLRWFAILQVVSRATPHRLSVSLFFQKQHRIGYRFRPPCGYDIDFIVNGFPTLRIIEWLVWLSEEDLDYLNEYTSA